MSFSPQSMRKFVKNIGRKDPFTWNFRCVNPADYEMIITFKARNDLVQTILKKSVNQLKKKNVLNADADLSTGDEIIVDGQYLNLIGVANRKNANIVLNEVYADGIRTLNCKIKSAILLRMQDYWDIKVVYEGQYIRVVKET